MHLACSLAEDGRTLLIDADPQQSALVWFERRGSSRPGGRDPGSAGTYMFPVVAIALGVLFRDERLHPVSLAGVVLVLAGAFVVSRAERRGPG